MLDNKAVFGAGVAIDAHNNVYWSFESTDGKGHVDEFVKGKGRPIDTGLVLPGASYGLAFDMRNRMIVGEGTQLVIVTLPHTIVRSFAQGTSPYGFALNDLHRIFIADRGSAQRIDKFSYPEGVLLDTIVSPNFIPWGVAVYPRP